MDTDLLAPFARPDTPAIAEGNHSDAVTDGHEGKTHSFAIENMSLSPTKAPSSLLVRDARVPPIFLSLPAEIRLAICEYVFASVLNTIVLSRRDCYPLARPRNDKFKGFMEAQWLERLYNCAHQQGTREMMLNMVSSAKKQAMQHGRDLQILERLIDWVSDEEVSCFSILTAEDWEDTKGSFRDKYTSIVLESAVTEGGESNVTMCRKAGSGKSLKSDGLNARFGDAG
ncbi:hypothetical protein B0A48_14857 [Cryoendolithus antarcticus]|uniref:Uncharacterized protein n=1 Tax=Cryoendolithus antarcticus TaxID=1507870 RepID=A0A1V8SIN1_9PEZI|nr:hypothetical protein B0A48_14857 [Cryoendolithus antarcticus]